MPAISLAGKRKLGPGQAAAVVDAPEGYVKSLSPLPPEVKPAMPLDGTLPLAPE
jgi:hypothetical protein